MSERVAAVEMKDVCVSFRRGSGTLRVLNQIDFRVERGEFAAIVGPSGSGKSTFFNIISGLMQPSTGTVLVDGEPVQGPSRRVGYMLQDDLLLPWSSVIDNVVLGLRIQGIARKEALDRARSQLGSYGLGGFEDAYPDELSGGMRQRVALARTMILEPSIILLDEPFSALDYQTRLVLEEEMLNKLKGGQKTALLVTHDIGEAISLADRIFVLSNRPAQIKAVYEIVLSLETHRTPVSARAAPEYSSYFTDIWNEMDTQVSRSGDPPPTTEGLVS